MLIALELIGTGCWAGQWKVVFEAGGTGVANGETYPWAHEHIGEFKDERHAPGVANNTHATSSGSVSARLEWIAAGVDDVPPTRLYLREYSKASAHAWCPAHQSIAVLDNGFGDPVVDAVNTNIEKYKKSEGVHLLKIDNPEAKSIVPLPTRYMKASGVNTCPNAAGGAHVYFAYVIEVIQFSVKARRKGATNFAQQAIVAAGAKESNEHMAELEVSTTPILPGVDITPFIATGGGGKPGDAQLAVSNPVTDSSGKITGTFRSSDVMQPATVRLDVGQVSPVTVEQSWADPNFSEWTPNVPIEYFDYEEPFPITFKPRIAAGVPITGHRLKFTVTQIEAGVWDDSVNDYVPQIFKAEEYPELINKLVDFDSEELEDSGGGVYTTNMVVHMDEENRLVNKIWVVAEDLSVLLP